MIEYKLSLASSGAVKTPGSMDALQLGYSRNSGVYRLRVSTADEWKGMTLRAFWHTPGGSPPASLVEDGVVEVPALVTAVPGEGCITFAAQTADPGAGSSLATNKVLIVYA